MRAHLPVTAVRLFKNPATCDQSRGHDVRIATTRTAAAIVSPAYDGRGDLSAFSATLRPDFGCQVCDDDRDRRGEAMGSWFLNNLTDFTLSRSLPRDALCGTLPSLRKVGDTIRP